MTDQDQTTDKPLVEGSDQLPEPEPQDATVAEASVEGAEASAEGGEASAEGGEASAEGGENPSLNGEADAGEADAPSAEANSSGEGDDVTAEDGVTAEDDPSAEDEAADDEAADDEAAETGEDSSAADEPSEETVEEAKEDDSGEEESSDDNRQWYILKVASNRENSIRDGLARRVKISGLDEFFGDIVVPIEEVAEFKNGKRRVAKRKLYPGYILVFMEINDDTWFLVRETPGIGDFTGAAGKPTPMEPHEVQRILKKSDDVEEGDEKIKTVIPFAPNDHVRVKEGHFENFEGDVESIDETHGRVTVMINIFGRPTPVELEHWQVEIV